MKEILAKFKNLFRILQKKYVFEGTLKVFGLRGLYVVFKRTTMITVQRIKLGRKPKITVTGGLWNNKKRLNVENGNIFSEKKITFFHPKT